MCMNGPTRCSSDSLSRKSNRTDVSPVVAGGEMVDSPRASAAKGRTKELREFHLALVDRLPGEQLDPGVEIDLLKRSDGEEAVEGVVLQRDCGEQ